MWISPSSQKSKFDSFFQKSFFHYFYTLFRPNSAQQCWKHASPMLLIYSLGKRVPKTRLYTGRTCILSRAEFDSEKWKKCNFHHLDVRIRPNSAQKLSNSAHRFYIWKVHQKCYMTTIYVFFISRTVINLQRHQVMRFFPIKKRIVGVNIFFPNGTWDPYHLKNHDFGSWFPPLKKILNCWLTKKGLKTYFFRGKRE